MPSDVVTRPQALRGLVRPQGGWMQREQVALGTSVTVQLWADDRTRGAAAMAAVMAEVQRIDRRCSPTRDGSELSLVNAAAAHAPVRISDELFQLVARAQEFARRTADAFDITDACAGALYDRDDGRLPDDISLARAVQAIGWRQLQLDPMTPALRFARAGMRIDLAGFARGHAVDRCIALLVRQGIRHALVSVGDASRLLGDRRGHPWTITLRDPCSPEGVVAALPLQDVAVSTSGAAPRVGQGPVLDPRTGRPATQLRSATVVAPDGLTAAALAKAVFVLGAERGLRLVEQHPGCDAVVVGADRRMQVTQGIAMPQAPAVTGSRERA